MKSRATFILRVERLEARDTPAALTPAQVRAAYGFNQITFGSVAGTGAGTTIAIVDAYNDPYIASDLDTFDKKYSINGGSQTLYQQYGAATSVLTVAKPEGTPANSSGWSGEIALDIEWAHAIAPGAKILLVEARSSSQSDLLAAVNYARAQPGVVAVSMSWGASEFSAETSASYQNDFTTPAGHTGVTFVGASGDNGAPGIWPAVSTNVLAVGGTRLTTDSAGNYIGETAWSGSGGGASRYFSKPSYQTAYTGTKRGSPDVSYDADPNSGFSVYNTYDGGWEQVGGTSAGAPQWSALIAIADQGRIAAGLGTLDGATQTLPAIYALPASDFHDVTTGSNGNRAGTGYDLVTGRGSPKANLVVAGLVGTTAKAAVTQTSTTSVSTISQFPWLFGRFSETERASNGLSTMAMDLPDLSVADPIDLRPGSRRSLWEW
jgi:subtilase family serine protease